TMNRSDESILGRRAVELRLITQAQLDACIVEQERARAEGKPVKPLGALFLQKGLINTVKLEKLVDAQKKTLAGPAEAPPPSRDADLARPAPARQTLSRDSDSALPTLKIQQGLDPSRDREGAPSSQDTMLDQSGESRLPPGAPAKGPHGKPFGRYMLLSELGRGGMGVVYKAWDGQLNRAIALKMILSREGEQADKETVARFLREAQTAAKLKHPGIVQIHEVGTHEGRHYFTMDFLEGTDLQSLLQSAAEKKLSMPLNKKLRILLGVARALQHAHQHGVIHRDLKPANVIVSPDFLQADAAQTGELAGGVVITDFGLARNVGRTGTSGLTVSGQVMGTPTYMSPEQAAGNIKAIGPASDVYALGVLLYEMLTGGVPFKRENVYELLKDVVEHEPPRPSTINRRVHKDLETICLKSLEKEPARRYPNAGGFADDLRRHLDGEQISARPVAAVTQLWRRASKKKSVLIPTAVAVLIAVAVIVGLVVASARRAKEARDNLAAARECVKSREYEKAKGLLIAAREKDDSNEEVAKLLAEVESGITARAAGAEEARLRAEREAEARTKALEIVMNASAAVRGARFCLYAPGSIEPLKRAVEKALKTCDEALSLCPKLAAAWCVKGDAHRQVYESEEALKCFEAALQIDPGHAMSLAGRGRLMLEKAEHILARVSMSPADKHRLAKSYQAKALDDIKRAAAAPAAAWEEPIDLDLVKAQELLAQVDYGRLMVFCDEMIAKHGNVFGVEEFVRLAGVAEYVLKNFDGAVKRLDAAIERRHNFPAAYMARGVIFYFQGQLDRALADLDKAVEMWPRNGDCFSIRAAIRAQKGDLDGALADCNEAIRIDPTDSGSYYNRGVIWQSKGETDRAMADFEECIRLFPHRADVYCNRGAILFARGDLEKAIADFNKTIECDQGYVEGYINRGMCRRAKNDMAGALADMDLAVKVNPSFPGAYYVRGNTRSLTGDLDGAIADYTETVRLSPRYADAYSNRGIMHERKGDVAGAIADWQKALEVAPPNWAHRKIVEERIEKAKKKE
ncbi:MAG: tetratricopeptide repeat protein, partial [Planctomycetota bacterium]|nr:tetratricopeptide repeat protein [Planctomycetota bacterium]